MISYGFDSVLAPRYTSEASDQPIDLVFMTQHLLGSGAHSIIPNPWIAYELCERTINMLRSRGYSDGDIRRDLGFILAELQRTLIEQRRELAKQVFYGLIQRAELRFFLLHGEAGHALPARMRGHAGPKLVTRSNDQLTRTLFEYEAEEDFNTLERSVALYLDQQYWVLAWYRNAVGLGYSIQGWQEQRVFSDFVVFGHDAPSGQPATTVADVYVLETKGNHLDNPDTAYKQELFQLCTELSQPRPLSTIAAEFANHTLTFQVVFADEWQSVLNAMFS